MTRRLAMILIAATIVVGAAVPAPAEDGAAAGKPASSSAAANLPQRLASLLAGIVVGTPIAIARKTAQAVVADTQELVGDRTSPFLVVPVGIFTSPWAVLTGTVEGIYAGAADGWAYSADKPFSKDCFSLGEMK